MASDYGAVLFGVTADANCFGGAAVCAGMARRTAVALGERRAAQSQVKRNDEEQVAAGSHLDSLVRNVGGLFSA